jgi:hypothetical protein
MDDLIAAILRRDPGGVVALVEGRVRNWSALLRKRWQQIMPDVQHRIVFVAAHARRLTEPDSRSPT